MAHKYTNGRTGALCQSIRHGDGNLAEAAACSCDAGNAKALPGSLRREC